MISKLVAAAAAACAACAFAPALVTAETVPGKPGKVVVLSFHSDQGSCSVTGAVKRKVPVAYDGGWLFLYLTIAPNARSGSYKVHAGCPGHRAATDTLKVKGAAHGSKKIISHVKVTTSSDPGATPDTN